MWKPPIPDDEEDRIEDLRRLDLQLTTPEKPLDDLTRHLARIFDVPGAFISFIDGDTQYYKSEVGLAPQFAESRTEPRDISLCSYVVGTNELLCVEDLAADPRFQENPGVMEFGIRFYAGAPLRGEGGHAVGSLCIVDQRPRRITPREQQMLRLLAEGVMAQVRLQVASRHLLDRSLKIESDLQAAVTAQRFLLPEARVEGGGWQIQHRYRPVEHLGGDLLDVQQRADGSWVVLIADVTGHGTSAALTAAMTKTAFVSAVGGTGSPRQVLTEMNRKLARVTPPGQFVTAQVLILNPHAGRITIASAGHPPPLLKRNTRAELIETNNGLPLIVEDQAEYHEVVLENILAGQSMLLYTDGAIEAANGQRRHLGVDGLRAVVSSLGTAPSLSLEDVMSAVLEYAHGRLADDVALLLIRRSAAEA